MNPDRKRIRQYLYEIKEGIRDLEELLDQYSDKEILASKTVKKAIKYTLIEIAEAISLTLQHILAKGYGTPVKGYIDTIKKSSEKGIISQEVFSSLKPFFDFRNSLIHRYWTIDDELILKNLRKGQSGFSLFLNEIERFLDNLSKD